MIFNNNLINTKVLVSVLQDQINSLNAIHIQHQICVLNNRKKYLENKIQNQHINQKRRNLFNESVDVKEKICSKLNLKIQQKQNSFENYQTMFRSLKNNLNLIREKQEDLRKCKLQCEQLSQKINSNEINNVEEKIRIERMFGENHEENIKYFKECEIVENIKLRISLILEQKKKLEKDIIFNKLQKQELSAEKNNLNRVEDEDQASLRKRAKVQVEREEKEIKFIQKNDQIQKLSHEIKIIQCKIEEEDIKIQQEVNFYKNNCLCIENLQEKIANDITKQSNIRNQLFKIKLKRVKTSEESLLASLKGEKIKSLMKKLIQQKHRT